MRVLALDTTTRAATMALVEDDRIVGEQVADAARTPAEQLPGDLQRLLDAAGATLSSIDVFAVAAGPGSFTGLRIGIATVQGLAVVTGRRVVPVSALEALAQIGSEGLPGGALVAAWIDARRRDVFSALYRVTEAPPFSAGRIVEVEPAIVDTPAATLSRWEAFDAPAVFVGDGARLFSDLIGGRGRLVAPPGLAGAIGRMAARRARAGDTVDPAGVQPLYVRRPDAEVARERHARSRP